MKHINVCGHLLTKAEFTILYTLYNLSEKNNPETEAQHIHDFRGYSAHQIADALGYQYPYIIKLRAGLIAKKLVKVIQFLSKHYTFLTLDSLIYFENLTKDRISALDLIKEGDGQDGISRENVEKQRKGNMSEDMVAN